MMIYVVSCIASLIIAYAIMQSLGLAIVCGVAGGLLSTLIMVVYRGIQNRT